jgi:hypothetical protein
MTLMFLFFLLSGPLSHATLDWFEVTEVEAQPQAL